MIGRSPLDTVLSKTPISTVIERGPHDTRTEHRQSRSRGPSRSCACGVQLLVRDLWN